MCSGLGAGVAAGAAAGVSATGVSGVAAGGSAIALTAAVRLGAARFFALIALARPRVAFFTGGDLPRRVAVLRRAGAVLRFVVDPRLPAFLVLVVFAFDFRAVLAMTSPSW